MPPIRRGRRSSRRTEAAQRWCPWTAGRCRCRLWSRIGSSSAATRRGWECLAAAWGGWINSPRESPGMGRPAPRFTSRMPGARAVRALPARECRGQRLPGQAAGRWGAWRRLSPRCGAVMLRLSSRSRLRCQPACRAREWARRHRAVRARSRRLGHRAARAAALIRTRVTGSLPAWPSSHERRATGAALCAPGGTRQSSQGGN